LFQISPSRIPTQFARCAGTTDFFFAADSAIASRAPANISALSLRHGYQKIAGGGDTMPTQVKVQIVQVPPEQRMQLNGATHACRHIADKLNNGERVVAGRDFSGGMQTKEWAATCGM
jgi:hypothetical protein